MISLAERRTSRRRALRTAAASFAAGVALTIGILAALDRGPEADARIALASTALVPGAGGEASVRDTDSGVEIRLDVHGLPRAAGGTYYQAWLSRPDGVHVPVGTFHTGAGEVVLWSGVALRKYRSLPVTLERADADQEPSGRVVLRTAGG